MLEALLQLLASSARNSRTFGPTVPTPAGLPDVDLSFCNADDHILIGIGGTRWGIGESSIPGLFAKVEIYASEDDVASMLDSIVFDDGYCSGDCLSIAINGRLGKEFADRLRYSEAFFEAMRSHILAKLRAFRSDPYVLQQARVWKLQRVGTDDISNILPEDAERERPTS